MEDHPTSKRARGGGSDICGGGGGASGDANLLAGAVVAVLGVGVAPPPAPAGFVLLEPWERAEHALLSRPTPFPNEDGSLPMEEFKVGECARTLAEARVLVIGAGGLGCDVLKNLALSGVRNIHVVDMDTIDLSNLNRQFLFRLKDVGSYKADVAAEFVMARVPGVAITPHREAIQAKPLAFFRSFDVVVGALDNLDARRWMSGRLVAFAAEGPEQKVIPYVDGASEALAGTVRVIVPTVTPCFECFVTAFPAQQTVFQVCTLTDKPRRPEHCVMWALLVAWPGAFPERACDKDCKADMDWLVARAQERAAEFSIGGVTFPFALGVAKNVIPAIAATNALTAAACTLEVLKLLTGASRTLDNTLDANGVGGQNYSTISHKKRADCPVCGPRPLFRVACGPHVTLGELLARLKDDPKVQLKEPLLMKGARFLYKVLAAPPAAAADGMLARYNEELATYTSNMNKTMGELLGDEGALGFVAQPPPRSAPPSLFARFPPLTATHRNKQKKSGRRTATPKSQLSHLRWASLWSST